MILDTNGLSAIADGDRAVEPFLRGAGQPALPVIVLGEFRYGIRQSRHRALYERWLSELINGCRLLVVDESTADFYADVRDELKRAGRPIPENDVWIAALARQHSMPLLSRNRHFDIVPGLRRLGW